MSATSTIRIIGRPDRYRANASHRALAIGCAALIGVVVWTPAEAASLDWTGATSSDWLTGSNWNSGTAPALADSVTIDTATPNPAQINGGVANINGSVFVGYSSQSALSILNGGSLTSGAVTLGNIPGGNGVATVSGAGSMWTTNDDITVGYRGIGALQVLNGGVVNFGGSQLSIADRPAGVGNVVVDGAGSILTGSVVLVGSSGVGALTVSNGAKLIGFGFTSFIGELVNSTGVVTVTGPGSSWTITGNSLIVGNQGNGTLTLADGGVFTNSNSSLIVGQFAGATGTINIGGVAGAAPVAPGNINVPIIFLGSGGSGTLNLNHTSANYILDQEIFGTGSINQIAGTTVLTGDAHGLTGATNVTGGRLAVNSSLGSIVNVSGGGILGGTGTVGGIVANNGGVIGPGNSIGTLNVAGNVTFTPGSIYQVETNAAGQSDKIAATGTATLNGGNIVASGVASVGTKYTILTANGGITGAFAGATGPGALPFFSYGLTYDTNNVYLSFGRSNLTFAAAGLTRNQIAAGSGADSLPVGSPLVGSLVQLDLAQARAAFDQLSGEVHASAKGVMIEDSRFIREAAIDRLRSAFDGVGAVAAPVTAYVDGRPVLASATTDSLAVWGRGFGSWGQWNGDGNAATVKRDIGGFMIGADAPSFDGWRLGIIGGYSRSNFRVTDRSSSGTSDNYHVGLYGGTQWGDLAFRSGLTFTKHDLSTSRTAAFPSFTDMLKADYSAGTTQGFGEFGYRIRAGRTALGMLAFEPFGNLAYVHLSTDGFVERGGNAALTGRSDDTGVTFTTLGIRSSLGGQLENGMTTLARGTLGWRHAFGDTTPVSILAFTGGSQFGVAGVPIAKNGAVVDLGFDVNVTPSAVLGVSYGGQIGSGVADHSLRGNFAVRF